MTKNEENKYLLWSYVNTCRMNSKKEDVKLVCWIGEYDVLIIFSDNTIYLYDTFLNMYRIIKYKTYKLTEEEWKFEFGRRLHDLLQRKYITETDFANMLGIKLQSLNRYIKGKTMPTAYLLNSILSILNISAEQLLLVQFILIKYLNKETEVINE